MTSLIRRCLMVCHSRQSACGGLIGNPEKVKYWIPAYAGMTEKTLLSKSPTNFGFTLVEILVALVIVAITVSVVLEAQITSLKIEQKARALQLFRFETERIFSTAHRVKNEEELTRLLETNNLCRIKSEKVQIESGTNALILIKHELNTEDLPSFSSVFFTRIPDHPGRRPDAGGIPVNPPGRVNGQKSVAVP